MVAEKLNEATISCTRLSPFKRIRQISIYRARKLINLYKVPSQSLVRPGVRAIARHRHYRRVEHFSSLIPVYGSRIPDSTHRRPDRAGRHFRAHPRRATYLRIDVSLNTLFIFVRHAARQGRHETHPRGYDVSRAIQVCPHKGASSLHVGSIFPRSRQSTRRGLSSDSSCLEPYYTFSTPGQTERN